MTLLIISWKRIQYNAVLAITKTIRGTTRDKIYKKLGDKALQSRRKLNCLVLSTK